MPIIELTQTGRVRCRRRGVESPINRYSAPRRPPLTAMFRSAFATALPDRVDKQVQHTGVNGRHDCRHYSNSPVAAKKAVRGCHQGREGERRQNRGPDIIRHCGVSSSSWFHSDMLLAHAALHHSRRPATFVDRRALEVRTTSRLPAVPQSTVAPWCPLSIVDTPPSAKARPHRRAALGAFAAETRARRPRWGRTDHPVPNGPQQSPALTHSR